MVELRPITEENFIDAFNLRLAPGQEEYVSHPIRSLAQAYVYRNQCQPFGIYAVGKMAGYVMVIYDYDVPEYDIWHMMIDEGEQGHGYGPRLWIGCWTTFGRSPSAPPTAWPSPATGRTPPPGSCMRTEAFELRASRTRTRSSWL